jgi:hypothetical protein
MFIGFQVEWKRIFSKKLLIIFTALFLLSQYLVFIGIQDYKTVLERKNNFREIERLKFKNCLSYELYAATGFKVMCQPSPITVFLGNSSDIGIIETIISSSDLIDVYESKKAQRIFSNRGKLGDLGGLIFYFGTLLMLYMGMTTFKNKWHLKLTSQKEIFKIIAYRLTILDLVFIMMLGISLLNVILNGISLNSSDINTFLNFSIYSIVFLDFFFFLGLLTAFLGRFKRFFYILPLIFWLLFILILPELVYLKIKSETKSISSLENIDIEKISELINGQENINEEFIKKTKNKKLSLREVKETAYEIVSKFINKVIDQNNQKEIELHNKIKELIQYFEYVSAFSPGNYYHYLSDEISGVGYNGYIRFFNYILDLKDKFSNFYIKKRYLSDDKKVELFIKDDENIFKAKSHVPGNFWAGFCLTVLYCLILFGIIWIIIRIRLNYRIKDKEKVDFDFNHLEEGEFYFVQCRDDAFREKLYRQLAAEPNVVGLDFVKGEDIDLELPPKDIVPYFCQISGFKDIEKVNSIIEKLGIEEFKYFKYKKSKDVSEEDLKKIYAAVLLAGASDKEVILMNNFLAGVRRVFERKLAELLEELMKQKKKVIYLSVDMFWSFSASVFNEIEEGDDFQIRQLSLKNISLI